MDAHALAPTSAIAVTPRAQRMAQLGLAPFVLGAVLIWLVRADAHPYVTLGLSVYAGLVVSFLGGIHWGLAMRQADPAPRLFSWALLATGIAWVGVMMPPYSGLVVEGVMLVVCYLVDRKVYPAEGLAHWLTLRFRLSAVAAFSCFVAAANA